MEERNEVIKQKTQKLMVSDEQQFYRDVYFILQQAREKAYNSANGIMTYAYWNVGRRIVEQEQYGEKKAQNGSCLIKNLSIQLSDEFGTNESQQIFASKYMTVLPTVEELQKELERNQLIYDSKKRR